MRSEPQVVRCTRCACEYRIPLRSKIACPTCGHESWVLALIPVAA